MMLLNYFGVFCWISGKREEIGKPGQFRGLTPRHRDPTQKPKSMPRRGMSTPWRGRERGLDKRRFCYASAKAYFLA